MKEQIVEILKEYWPIGIRGFMLIAVATRMGMLAEREKDWKILALLFLCLLIGAIWGVIASAQDLLKKKREMARLQNDIDILRVELGESF